MSYKRTEKNDFKSKLPRYLGLLIAVLMLIAVPMRIAHTLSAEPVISAFINGTHVGTVRSSDVLEKAYVRLYNNTQKISDSVELPVFNVSFDYTYTNDPVYLTEEDCYDFLWAQVADQFCEAFVLYVDEKQAGANVSREDLEAVLSGIEKQLIESISEEYSFAGISSRIRIEKQLCHISELKTASEIDHLLNPLFYECPETSAEDEVISVRTPSLTAATPTKRTATSEFALDYTLTGTETAEAEIPFETVYIDDYDSYVGTETVMSEGRVGSKIITYKLTFDDSGTQIAKEAVNEDIVTEPAARVILVGKQEVPKTAPTGNFIWPCHAPKGVSSYYGWRDLYGKADFHLGIDIPDKKGSLIWAADGGTVTFAAYTYSYGYNVIIEHSDGMSTLYAHLNSISVSKGDLVYQGQQIGTMGTTGVAYGSHLHFEVRINNKTVDPMPYLPK